MKIVLVGLSLIFVFLPFFPQEAPSAMALQPASELLKEAAISSSPKPGVEIKDIAEDETIDSSETPPVRMAKVRIPCGRDKVNTEIFYPNSNAPAPVVILLHGSHPQRTDAYYDVMAQDLAMRGYLCLFPHYFERGRKDRGTRSQWTKTIGSVIDYAEKMPNADISRIAIIGYSLGSFLALGYVPTDKRVGCLVAFYGGLSGCDLPSASEHMPPTLLIHGMKDRTVPARRSLEAFKSLRETQKPVSVVIYPDVGHGFTLHKKGEWDDSVSEDSWTRTLAFINYNLNFPAWTPEVPVFSPDHFQISLNGESKDVLKQKQLETPYLDKVFDCGEKVFIDPSGEEYTKLLKESRPPPKKKPGQRSAKKK